MRIGVMALQGSFQCHCRVLEGLGSEKEEIETREVREVGDLEGLDGLVLPGGESSAMGVLNGDEATPSAGIFAEVKKLVASGLPTYGTCAGLILLCEQAVGQKSGGQPLIGGLDATVCRNFFGSQVQSFEVPLQVKGFEDGAFPAVFIRAPAVLRLGDKATALASVRAKPCEKASKQVDDFFETPEPGLKKRKKCGGATLESKQSEDGAIDVVVAARQANILVTAFHPELTQDTRWHRIFLDICRRHKLSQD